jgi:hypothetical protein
VARDQSHIEGVGGGAGSCVDADSTWIGPVAVGAGWAGAGGALEAAAAAVAGTAAEARRIIANPRPALNSPKMIAPQKTK